MIARIWVTAFLVPLLGCQAVLDVSEQQCRTDADCVGLFGRDYVCTGQNVCALDDPSGPAPTDGGSEDSGATELPPQWACLNDPPRDVIPVSGLGVTLRFAVTDFDTLTVPPGLTAKACEARITDCDNPVVENVTPNAEGFLEFNLPHGWRGFEIVSAPDYVDSLVFSNRPVGEDAETEGPTILKPSQIMKIAEGGGETTDPTKGIVIITVRDCNGDAAPGVSFIQEDQMVEEMPFYFEGTLPDRNRTTTTTSTLLTRSMAPIAAGGFSRVTPGYVTFAAVLPETGHTIGRLRVLVRALTMTFADIYAGY